MRKSPVLIAAVVLLTLVIAAVGAAFLLSDKAADKAETMVSIGADEKTEATDAEAGETGDAEAATDADDDAASYYEANSDVLDVVAAQDSADTLTEDEVLGELAGRGFEECVVTSEYTMDGEYAPATEVAGYSDAHPTYKAEYTTPSGELWVLFVFDGVVMANPTSYNFESTRDVQTVVSESESVVAYDSQTNTFYHVVPHESMLHVVQVDRIDAATLDALTVEELDQR
ncbi:hypothetical protein [Slackia heliotrinireducens]|uniref:hypothetical protein n=1 Tax=Slackia heliotrinireducens TaxID=84110 RepID=UPI003315A64A